MKIYISGKISGLPKEVYVTNFLNAEMQLKEQGHEVANPIVFTKGIDENDYPALMGKCIEELLRCEAIYLLKDWDKSKGARTEAFIASEYNIKMILEK
jgi:hypothetical protein